MKNRKSKKYIVFIQVLTAVLILSSFASIVICGKLRENGYGDFWWPLVGLVGAFTCLILAIVVAYSVLADEASYEIERKNKKYNAMAFIKLKNVSEHYVKEVFDTHRYRETRNGYLRKKVLFNFKGSICYYVQCVNSSDVKVTLEKEYAFIDKIKEGTKNICFILFIYKSNIDKADFDKVREAAKNFIINETLFPVLIFRTSVIVLVDDATKEGYFLDINSRIGISIYNNGCKLLKKYFVK